MKVSVEQINGTPCTVIRRRFDPEAVRASLAIGVPVLLESSKRPLSMRVVVKCSAAEPTPDSFYEGPRGPFLNSRFDTMTTILPALPRNPTAADAPLLYRYAAEGLFAAGTYFQKALCATFNNKFPQVVDEITHCVTADGESGNGCRVEVAIIARNGDEEEGTF